MINSKIKICGIKDKYTLNCCIKNKIDFFGLIFYEKSPRNISLNQAQKLIKHVQNNKILSVGVFVNEDIIYLNKILTNLKIDYVQLHGKEENEYIKFIKKNNRIKVIKTISIKTTHDFKQIEKYPNADMFLFDYKPIKDELPGGNAKQFDWELIKKIKINKNWFLSGGINEKNINNIKNYANPYGIDISSGVEESPGNKSNNKIDMLVKIYESK